MIDEGLNSWFIGIYVIIERDWSHNWSWFEVMIDPGLKLNLIGIEVMIDIGLNSWLIGIEVMIDPG